MDELMRTLKCFQFWVGRFKIRKYTGFKCLCSRRPQKFMVSSLFCRTVLVMLHQQQMNSQMNQQMLQQQQMSQFLQGPQYPNAPWWTDAAMEYWPPGPPEPPANAMSKAKGAPRKEPACVKPPKEAAPVEPPAPVKPPAPVEPPNLQLLRLMSLLTLHLQMLAPVSLMQMQMLAHLHQCP